MLLLARVLLAEVEAREKVEVRAMELKEGNVALLMAVEQLKLRVKALEGLLGKAKARIKKFEAMMMEDFGP